MKYATLFQFFSKHKLVHRDTPKWRLTKPVVGEINGLPDYRGTLIATNGILCYLENELGIVYQGHLDWFNPDRRDAVIEDTEGNVIANPSGLKTSKHEALLADLLSLINQ